MIKHEQLNDSSQRHGMRSRIVAAVLVVMLAFPALAMGQTLGDSPSDAQYGGTDQNLGQQVKSGGDASDPGSGGPSADTGLSGNVGPLPFTGFDVIAMAAVALAVTGVGLALQRAVTRESTTQV